MASYEKRANGWTVRFDEYVDGKRVKKRLSGFDTKKSAQIALQKYQIQHETVSATTNTKYTFAFITDAYLADKAMNDKPSTISTARCSINKNILPTFGNRDISQITPLEITNWLNSLTQATSYKHQLRGLVNCIFNYAERMYNIKNPMPKVSKIRNIEPKREMQIWTPEEFHRFEEAIENPIYRLYFKLLFIAGCRRGEAQALTWNDVNDLSITISKTFSNKAKQGTWCVQSPKTRGSYRTIAMPKSFMNELESIHTHDGYIFSYDGKAPITTTPFERAFKNGIAKSGVKPIRVHDLRHSCVSYLISLDFPILAISKRLGHENIAMTLNTYSHLMPKEKDRLATAFDNF